MAADRTGQQFGNYRLVSLLGQGGFAEVYLGEHIYLDTQAAIKILHAQIATDDIEVFRAEARTVARLIHPHIVRVLEFGLEGTTPYLVTDYAPNGSLRERHRRGTRVPLPIVVSYTRQIAEALQYAHEQKIVHRDIKPENMLLGHDNRVLLGDFGIAQVAQSTRYMTTQGFQDLAGTIFYMAPEQMRARAIPASDQYSLAVVVYEWLSGERPFTGTFPEIAVKHTLMPPPPLREMLPELPEEVEQVVTKALAKESEQRYPSVLAFAQALEEAYTHTRGSLPVSAYPISSVSRHVPSNADILISTEEAQEAEENVPVHAREARTSSPLVELEEEPVLDSTTLPIDDEVLASVQAMDRKLAEWEEPSPRTEEPEVVRPAITRPERTITRRGVLLGGGIAGAALLGSAGFFTWFVRSRQAQTPLPGEANEKPALFTYSGHASYVWDVAWSPDGRYLASASDDKTVHVITAKQGELVGTPYSRHSDSVYSVSWSPDSKRIASGGADQRLETWEALNGYYPREMKAASWVWTVAWSPDGTLIASGGGDRVVTLWNVTNGERILTYKGHQGNINAVAWSPNGRYIASASSDRTTQIWESRTGRLLYRHTSYPSATTMRSVAWSPDSTRIAVACDNQTVQLWDALTDGHRYIYQGHRDLIYSVAWSPDGKYLASGSDDRTVQVWEVENGQMLHVCREHSEGVHSLSWSPDSRYLASGSWDKTVKVWLVR